MPVTVDWVRVKSEKGRRKAGFFLSRGRLVGLGLEAVSAERLPKVSDLVFMRTPCFSLLLLFLWGFQPLGSAAQKIFSAEHESRADVKVFVVDYESRADLLVFKEEYESRAAGNEGLWHFVEYESRADKKIFFVDYESRADLKVFFVAYESRAGWQNKSMQHWLY
jgi:hypothetical protein